MEIGWKPFYYKKSLHTASFHIRRFYGSRTDLHLYSMAFHFDVWNTKYIKF